MEAFFEGRDEKVEKAGVLVYYVVALLAIAGTVLLCPSPWTLAASCSRRSCSWCSYRSPATASPASGSALSPR